MKEEEEKKEEEKRNLIIKNNKITKDENMTDQQLTEVYVVYACVVLYI